MPVLLFVEVRNTSNILTFDFSGILSHTSAPNDKTIQTYYKGIASALRAYVAETCGNLRKLWGTLRENGGNIWHNLAENGTKIDVQTLIQKIKVCSKVQYFGTSQHLHKTNRCNIIANGYV